MSTIDRLAEYPDRTLRSALVANAAFSAVGGIVAVFAGAQVADLMDVNAWLVRAVGAALLVFAVDVWLVSRRPESQLVPLSRLISVSDASWVLGTVVVIAAGLVSGAGIVVLGIVGAVVADFAIVQWWAASKLSSRTAVVQAA